ncbi:SulP family inorganic anion transporter [Oharaeibacter diazotrophicus]|uniref:SulP family sulfate permease n=1 Tax=Oharaeibacter diazotrophicus TaxID=1920512 RepID=A0A4R6RM58_9HYPH|nr:SulP family inorganic anion transporter [Oharaeibacter diazotrophicus]TDP86846.1 SulP family sulfate permease [Oharaeibacter diazotrophicus]BBE71211.1 C4-dicarboxylic acid transporter DauA [Pleomorphomonas sp. SM30]GLS77966.1 sodium-independent anion transporter [Oharaeibacter diazotrophicus]
MTALPGPRPSGESDFAALFTPKLVTALREGYTLEKFRADAVAGLTVAIVALPLAMAIAVASGVGPERGLFTAIVAGFLISALGGSRFQIGGPTAAFIVVVFNVVERVGYQGLVLATLMAGVILVVVGFLRLGTYIKYIPYPVVTGFTAGIAVSIGASQLKDALGLDAAMPGDFVAKMETIAGHIGEARPATVAITVLSMALILVLRRFRPHWPGFLIAVVLGSLAVTLLGLDSATIGSRFGGVPSMLPAPTLPAFDLATLRAVTPDALTIALLAGIESLLSAVIADGMTGRRHRSNCELVAQGVANVASAMFGGISATGAIARTATNIRSGARTPVAGMLHAAFLLAFMLVAAPVLAYVPLATLAAILLVVAWNISEIHHIHKIMTTGGNGDRFVLAGTFLLTVGVDLTVGIGFGVVVAAVLFMHRMAESVAIEHHDRLFDEDVADRPGEHEDLAVPPKDVVVYRIRGPFFFGATQQVGSVLERIGDPPRLFALDFSGVPFVDSTAATALQSFAGKAARRGTRVAIAGASTQVRAELERFGVRPPEVSYVADVEAALAE